MKTNDQQGDVLLYQTTDGGEINVRNGVVQMTGGLEVAVYLSLFGGNEDDDGTTGNARQWWGNWGEEEPARQYRSETGYLINRLTAAPYNLNPLQRAATRDLQWLLDTGTASAVSVDVSIPGANKVKFSIEIEADGSTQLIEFSENWRATE